MNKSKYKWFYTCKNCTISTYQKMKTFTYTSLNIFIHIYIYIYK